MIVCLKSTDVQLSREVDFYIKIKMKIEMGNVSKRQQPDQRADNSRRQPMVLQYSEKLPH